MFDLRKNPAATSSTNPTAPAINHLRIAFSPILVAITRCSQPVYRSRIATEPLYGKPCRIGPHLTYGGHDSQLTMIAPPRTILSAGFPKRRLLHKGSASRHLAIS